MVFFSITKDLKNVLISHSLFLSLFFSGKRVVGKTIKAEKELKNIFEIQ